MTVVPLGSLLGALSLSALAILPACSEPGGSAGEADGGTDTTGVVFGDGTSPDPLFDAAEVAEVTAGSDDTTAAPTPDAPTESEVTTVGCDDGHATTGVTVIDATPLAGVSDPVRHGFDPLLPGDAVRVTVAVDRPAGSADALLAVSFAGLSVHPGSTRLDGADVIPSHSGNTRIEIGLPGAPYRGSFELDATLPATGPGLLALDARVVTSTGCPVLGSASGARIQLTGSIDPKHSLCSDLGDTRSLQISTGVPDKNTSVYTERNGKFPGLGASYTILTQMTLCLIRSDDRTVSLSGSADGTRPWTIDNHLLIEVFDGDPSAPSTTRVSAWSTTSVSATAPSRYADGEPISMLAHASLPGDYTGSRTPSYFSFPAGVVQLDQVLPIGQRSWVRLTGLDSGVAGHLSRLYIHAAPAGSEVAECRSHRDCPRTDSYNGSDTRIRSGCIAGRCEAVTCTGDAACAIGQRCLQGFCSDRCTSDDGCPAGMVCGLGGVCADLGAGGCRSFADCPEGEVCFFGRCEAGCFHPVNQDPSYGENYGSSLCATSAEACPRCGAASERCWNNYCRDCELDAHCGASLRCVNFACAP